MANQQKEAAAPAMKAIEELAKERKIQPAVFEGVKAANGWKPGKQVTENEFTKACDDFNKAPIDGSKKKEVKQ